MNERQIFTHCAQNGDMICESGLPGDSGLNATTTGAGGDLPESFASLPLYTCTVDAAPGMALNPFHSLLTVVCLLTSDSRDRSAVCLRPVQLPNTCCVTVQYLVAG
jgi:hypothetical protein